jgi:pimeloyl-ACP methyl ester carboxylesterase
VPIRYARSGDVNVAYQVTGDGPIDLVLVHGFFSHLEVDWEHPASRRIIERLSSFSRLIRFDKRGTGLSDRSVGMPDFEARMDDMRAVMDAAGSERAVLLGYSEGGPMCVLFAATYPARAQALVLYGTYAKRLRTDDYPWAPTWEERVAAAEYLEEHWGEEFDLGEMAPNAPPDFIDWAGVRGRAALSPRGAHDLILMNSKADVREVLPLVAGADARAPPDRRPRRQRRRGALPRRAHSRREVRRAHGGRPHPAHEPRSDPRRGGGVHHGRQAHAGLGARPRDGALHRPRRVDGEGARAGRRAWAELLERHHEVVRHELAQFDCEEIDTAGDGFLALGEGPTSTIRCALSIVDAVGRVGLSVRAGVHTGEVERPRGGSPRGIAVHVGARVAAAAGANEVFVSSTTNDLVAGSGIELEDRGEFELKGVGRRRLYAATA